MPEAAAGRPTGGCVGEMTLSVIPRLLGAGIPMFGPGTPDLALRLVDARPWPSGLVQPRYARSGQEA